MKLENFILEQKVGLHFGIPARLAHSTRLFGFWDRYVVAPRHPWPPKSKESARFLCCLLDGKEPIGIRKLQIASRPVARGAESSVVQSFIIPD